MPLADFHHRWIPGSGRRTLLLLHGTGGDENDLIPIGQTLDPAAGLLSVRGRVDEHGSKRFFRRLREGVFDLDNMSLETEALAAFLRDAVEEYGIDPAGLSAAGFSNGANMAASLMLREPGTIRGGFLMRAMVPFEPEPLPDLAGTRILISSGKSDPIVPVDNAKRLAQIFSESGASVEHLWLEAGHNLTRQELEHARAWLEET